MPSIMESLEILLILAGKGHEDYQEIKGKKYRYGRKGSDSGDP